MFLSLSRPSDDITKLVFFPYTDKFSDSKGLLPFILSHLLLVCLLEVLHKTLR